MFYGMPRLYILKRDFQFRLNQRNHLHIIHVFKDPPWTCSMLKLLQFCCFKGMFSWENYDSDLFF